MSNPTPSELTEINSLFRPMNQYVEVIADIMAILHKRHFKAHDLHVIAAGLGWVGNQAIRRQFIIPEYAENVVRIAVSQGIAAMELAERLASEGRNAKD